MEKLKEELLGLNQKELEDFVLASGQPKYRARQIYKWIYTKETSSFYEMTDLPKEVRNQFDDRAVISIPRVLKQRASVDGTRKFLMELEDKKKIETVLIPHSNDKKCQYTLCISTQVGCPIGCAFCATGQSGFLRNLAFHEIVGQVLGSKRELQKRIKNADENLIGNIVYMGMGEPLLNFDATIKSVNLINDPKGLNIGQRHITISTSGEVKGIKRLKESGLQITLAISLHAADNQLRDKLIPINRKYPLEVLMEAVSEYIERTNRRVTFEYIMLDEVNIRKQDAENLIQLIKPLMANINLIPYNKVKGLAFERPGPEKIRRFFNWLAEGGLNVTMREEKGSDIEAACGQLAMKKNSRNQ